MANDGARDLDIFSTVSYFAATSLSANFEPTPGSFVMGIPDSDTGAGSGFFFGAAFFFAGFFAADLAFFFGVVFFLAAAFFGVVFFLGLDFTRSPRVD